MNVFFSFINETISDIYRNKYIIIIKIIIKGKVKGKRGRISWTDNLRSWPGCDMVADTSAEDIAYSVIFISFFKNYAYSKFTKCAIIVIGHFNVFTVGTQAFLMVVLYS